MVLPKKLFNVKFPVIPLFIDNAHKNKRRYVIQIKRLSS